MSHPEVYVQYVASDVPVLSAHNFFAPQPVKDADIFVVRFILHDWPDKYCYQILRRLREAAAPFTRLMIIEHLMAYACVDEGLNSIPGATIPPPPAPLLANGGQSSTIAYFQDLQMLSMLNGKERTVAQFKELLEQTGWKLQAVTRGRQASNPGKIVAVPA